MHLVILGPPLDVAYTKILLDKLHLQSTFREMEQIGTITLTMTLTPYPNPPKPKPLNLT
jgi:hypothetical protein